MGIRITMSGVAAEFARMDKEAKKKISKDLSVEGRKIVSDLKSVTPVDTGNARDHWKIDYIREKDLSIVNEVPYIEYLNNGSSAQSPAHFVESVALRHGRPIGQIITVEHT